MTTDVSRKSRTAVEIKGLTKSFSGRLALKKVDLTIKDSEFLTVVGPNGAGKTTLLRVLAALSRPSSGDVTVSGFRLGKESTEIRRCIGYVPHQTLLYDELTAYENLKFYGTMYDVPNLQQRIHELAEKMALSTYLYVLIRTLSRGIQQRLSIMRALLHNPKILLLDEPETGLDQQARTMLGEVLDIGNRTIIMSSHRLESGLELGDRIAILASGRIVFQESTDKLDTSSFSDIYARHTEGK